MVCEETSETGRWQADLLERRSPARMVVGKWCGAHLREGGSIPEHVRLPKVVDGEAKVLAPEALAVEGLTDE